MAKPADDEPDGDDLGVNIPFQELATSNNVVDLLEPDQLKKIARWVCDDYRMDDDSREPWLKANKAGMDLAMSLTKEQKDFPFEGAANVKYPLIAIAALQFNARAYPAICPGDAIVKGKISGHDPQGTKTKRATRLSDFMSWQLGSQMPEWEDDTDTMTLVLPISGCMFRKVYFDPSLKRNVTRLIPPENLVVNYRVKSFREAPRTTEKLFLYDYEIQERINSGRFIDFDYDDSPTGDVTSDDDEADSDDRDGQQLFLEQHRLLDLDGDDYPEPYVVTVHYDTEEVCRIVPNWTPDTVILGHTANEDGSVGIDKVISIRKRDYYVKYTFLPAPDGGAYGLGFGWLLTQTNEAINTTLNQLFDAGGLANMQGGIISSALGIRDKTLRIARGEWKVIQGGGDIRGAIVPIKYDGPSEVLFKLLQFLIETGKELAAVKDVLTGDTAHANAPVGTTLALIEQGLQIFTSIYKRIHRALKEELGLLAELNRTNVSPEEYNAFFDGPEQYDPAQDFDLKDMDVVPVSDPASVTKQQKVAKAQAEMQIGAGDPAIDQVKLKRRMFEAIGTEDIDELFVPPPPPPTPEEQNLVKRAAVAEVEGKEAEVEQKTADATNKLATGIKTIAEAGQIDMAGISGQLDMILRMLAQQHGMEMDVAGQSAAAQPGGVPGMAPEPGNGMGAGPAPEAGGMGTPAPAGGADQQPPAAIPQAMGQGAPQPQLPQGAL